MSLCIMIITAVTYLFNSRLGALFLLFVAGYYMFAKRGTIYERLLRVIVYSSSYYTFDVFGGRQRLSLCILCVILLCILLTLNILKRGARVSVASALKLILLVFFLGGYGLSTWNSYAPLESIFSTYQLIILVYLILIIPVVKNEELIQVDTEVLMKTYISGICAVAITLYIQYGVKTLLGFSIGQVFEYNSERVIYNVYFLSKSVLSLYFAVGMMYFFTRYVNNKQTVNIIWLALFSGAMLINNSRTGLACFAICAGLYCVRNFGKILSSVRITVMLIILAVVVLYIVQLMLESRAALEGFADDNGRSETILKAIELLPKHIFVGVGGSPIDVQLSSMKVSPHNFFVAYMIQFGVLGGLAANILIFIPLIKRRNRYSYFLLCVIMGGMLFAGWQNALFTVPIYLFSMLEERRTDVIKYM